MLKLEKKQNKIVALFTNKKENNKRVKVLKYCDIDFTPFMKNNHIR